MNGPRLRYSVVLPLLLGCSLTTSAAAQTGVIMGRVTDAHSGAPLSGGELVVIGPALSGLTRSDGQFLIIDVPAGTQDLRVNRLGYRALRRSVTVTADAAVVVDFALSHQPLGLEDIIVTGAAGAARRKEIAGAVAQLDVQTLLARPATVSDFLQGGAVGVEITGGSGEAGQSKQIRLRGNTSMVLSNHPLIYVDGVRMMDGAFPSAVARQFSFQLRGANITTSPLDIINVGDIERIEIVKGPAAATLFKTGSAGGVIQIFTKRGSPGAPIWTAEIRQGTGWVKPFGANGVDYLHLEHYMRDAWWGGGYEGGSASGDCVQDDPRWEGVNSSAEGPCSWPGSQWYQTYRLGVSGGEERLDYFVSGEYENDTYTLPLDRLKKYGVRANLRAKLLPTLELESHTAYSKMSTANTASGNSVESILLSSMRQDRNYLSSADPRVIAELFELRNEQGIDRVTSGLTAAYTPSLSVSHRLTLGYDFSGQNLRSLRELGFILFPEGSVTTQSWERDVRTIDYLGRYAFSLTSELASTLSVGGQFVDDWVGSVVTTGQGFSQPGATAPEETNNFGRTSEAARTMNAGLFAQNVLEVSDRWFFTTGFRLDVHSARGETFVRLDPKVGAAWVLSDEQFWPTGIGALRIRSAFGRSGAAATPFQQAVSYRGGDAPPDTRPPGILEPESTSEWEIGVDGALLRDRLSVGFTYYRQTTSDALVSVPDMSQTSFGRSDLLNVGKIQNRGIEVQIDAALVRADDWSLDAGVGITTNNSKVLDLGGVESFLDLNGDLIVGHPVPANFGRRVANPDAINGPWSSSRYAPDENGLVGGRLFLGPQLPTHFVSPALSLRAPGSIIFTARGEYRGGNMRRANPVSVSRSVVSPLCLPYYLDPAVSLALRADTPDIWQERCTPIAASDYWFDADYFKLRSLSATVPMGFAFPDAIREATLTIALDNAYTWYRSVPWWDLEILANDGANDDGLGSSERVPAPVTMSVTLRVTF